MTSHKINKGQVKVVVTVISKHISFGAPRHGDLA